MAADSVSLSLQSTPSSDSIAPSEASSLPPSPTLSPQDSIDFLLHPAEIAKGRRAAERYLSTVKSEENRRMAAEALETLATVVSGGKCDSLDFPWQQIRPYHGAAALTILKEKGAPARIEALRCRRDATRSYHVVPDSYPPRQVQQFRSTLTNVIAECCDLGFVQAGDDEASSDIAKGQAQGKKKATTPKSAGKHRLLGDGELRALVAASISEEKADGSRDAVLFSLVNRGLKIAEITGLKIESVRFSNKTGECQIVARPGRSGGRGRRVARHNRRRWLD